MRTVRALPNKLSQLTGTPLLFLETSRQDGQGGCRLMAPQLNSRAFGGRGDPW
jgi:hypothetical protein